MATLFQHPLQMAAVKKDLSLIPQAIEETMRFCGPVVRVSRLVLEDFTIPDSSSKKEDAELTIKKDDAILINFSDANKDPTVFKDPETFNIFRSPDELKKHVVCQLCIIFIFIIF